MRPLSLLSMQPIHLKWWKRELCAINTATLIQPMQSKGHITSLVLHNKHIYAVHKCIIFGMSTTHCWVILFLSCFLLVKFLFSSRSLQLSPLSSILFLILRLRALNFFIHLFPVLIHCYNLYRLDSNSVNQLLHYFQLHVIHKSYNAFSFLNFPLS